MSLQGGKKFYGLPMPFRERDLSRFEALVRKRESLLKSIYERRKGEGWRLPRGKPCLLSRRSPVAYPKKNNKNITRASKNKIFATAHASFGKPFAFKTANFMPKEARGIGSPCNKKELWQADYFVSAENVIST
jgi:hypothetical protein